MFAVGIIGLDLSSSIRYFDVVMNNIAVNTPRGDIVPTTNSSNIVLKTCSVSQWVIFKDKLNLNYSKLGLDQFLCPQKDSVISIQGKSKSQTYKYADVSIRKCTDNSPLYPGTTCATQTQMNDFLSKNTYMTLNFYYINSAINGNLQKYKSYYV